MESLYFSMITQILLSKEKFQKSILIIIMLAIQLHGGFIQYMSVIDLLFNYDTQSKAI